MRPPVCRLCDRSFQPGAGGELLAFRREGGGDDDRPPGWTGHPDHRAWFCDDHSEAAREYTHLPLAEALERLR